jgi:hypothetical protein
MRARKMPKIEAGRNQRLVAENWPKPARKTLEMGESLMAKLKGAPALP